MAQMRLRGRPVHSIFDALGTDENGMTAALGLALVESSAMRRRFLAAVAPGVVLTEPVLIDLQRFDLLGRGFTDIELLAPAPTPEVHIIVEAKRGWAPPSKQQLARYDGRFAAKGARVQRLVVLTQNGAERVVLYQIGPWKPTPPATLVVIGWTHIVGQDEAAALEGVASERHRVAEFAAYVREVADMQDMTSNRVFVGSISRSPEAWTGFPMSPMDVIERGRYFFPATGGPWPKSPPNYIAFRYDGRLQAIHHVDAAVVIPSGVSSLPASPTSGAIRISY
jgi:hypothetical protein